MKTEKDPDGVQQHNTYKITPSDERTTVLLTTLMPTNTQEYAQKINSCETSFFFHRFHFAFVREYRSY